MIQAKKNSGKGKGNFLELWAFSQLLSVSDELSNFISSIVSDDFQSKHFSSKQLPLSELQLNFSTRPYGLVGNFSLKVFFWWFNPFAKREDFPHFLHKHDVYGMLELNVYSFWSLRKSKSSENVNSLPNLVSNDCLQPVLLFAIDKISSKRP